MACTSRRVQRSSVSRRVRTRDGTPFICETIRLPQELFPDLAQLDPLPNTLYDLFQKTYGILLVRTEDRLSATAADAETARVLTSPPARPCFGSIASAFGLDDRPIEWRVSLCHLPDAPLPRAQPVARITH